MFKRILYTSLVDLSLPNGPGVNERVFLKDMAGRFGKDLCAVVPKPARGFPEELAEVDRVFIPVDRPVRSPRGWAQVRAMGSWSLLRATSRFQPDLVVMRSGAMPLPHFLFSVRSNVPYVLKTVGDVSFQRFYANHRVGRLLSPLNEAMFRRLLRGALCLDLVSSRQRDIAIRVDPTLAPRTHVIDNGVDLESFSPRAATGIAAGLDGPERDPVIGYVGNLPMQRGGKEVIDALAAFQGSRQLRGLIVGDSGEAESLARYAREKGVAGRVNVVGEVDYSQVPGLMAAMDIGLSILRPEERGASEQKVRQYLASGLCVVGTSGSNDFLKGHDFARVVDSSESHVLKTAIESLLAGGSERLSHRKQAARSFAESELSFSSRNDRRLALWQDHWRASVQ